jgi:hypothetical protein
VTRRCIGEFSRGFFFLYHYLYIFTLHNGVTPRRKRCTRRKIKLIEGNAKCRHLKKLTYKGSLWQVFICLRPKNPIPPPPPLQTVQYMCIQYTYSHRKGGGVEPERRLEGQQFTKQGRVENTNLSINFEKYLLPSPFTSQFLDVILLWCLYS